MNLKGSNRLQNIQPYFKKEPHMKVACIIWLWLYIDIPHTKGSIENAVVRFDSIEKYVR